MIANAEQSEDSRLSDESESEELTAIRNSRILIEKTAKYYSDHDFDPKIGTTISETDEDGVRESDQENILHNNCNTGTVIVSEQNWNSEDESPLSELPKFPKRKSKKL